MPAIGSQVSEAITDVYRRILGGGREVQPQDVTTQDMEINGIHVRIKDFGTSALRSIVAAELQSDAYNIEQIHFQPGDVVIDIGAAIGMVSIYLARRYPRLTIHAFEPIPANYNHLVRNLRLNRVRNVHPHPLAITSDGRDFEMIVHLASNPGGGTGYLRDMRLPDHAYCTSKSITLDRVFAEYRIQRCRLLKIDCEGAEHEILWNTRCLDQIDYLSGEFHINRRLAEAGYSIEALIDHCQQHLAPERLKVTVTQMAE